MENTVKISIIMPWHNGSEYLEETLGYIRKQTFTDYELICVDDESTDDTCERLLEHAKEDARIRVYPQKKANAGAARNFGMSHARGEFLAFWDSDDLFEPKALELLYNKIKEDDADVVVCNADLYDGEENCCRQTSQYLKKDQLPDKMPFSIADSGKYIFTFTSQVPWNKLYRKSFIDENKLQYQEIPRINDHYFVSLSMLLAGKITVLDETLIHYRINQQGNLTANTSATPLCKYAVQRDLKKAMEDLGLWQKEDVRRSFINKALNTLLHGLNIQNNIEGFRTLFDVLKSEGFEALEIRDYGEDYYYDPLEYRNLKLILENNCDAFLLNKYLEYRQTISRKNDAIRVRNAQIRELRKKESELNYIKNTKRYRYMEKATQIVKTLLGRNRTSGKRN